MGSDTSPSPSHYSSHSPIIEGNPGVAGTVFQDRAVRLVNLQGQSHPNRYHEHTVDVSSGPSQARRHHGFGTLNQSTGENRNRARTRCSTLSLSPEATVLIPCVTDGLWQLWLADILSLEFRPPVVHPPYTHPTFQTAQNRAVLQDSWLARRWSELAPAGVMGVHREEQPPPPGPFDWLQVPL